MLFTFYAVCIIMEHTILYIYNQWELTAVFTLMTLSGQVTFMKSSAQPFGGSYNQCT